MTPDLRKGMDTLTGILLGMDREALCQTLDCAPWGLLALLVHQAGGQDGELGRRFQRCREWGALEVYLPSLRAGDELFMEPELDEALAEAARNVPGFAWESSHPRRPFDAVEEDEDDTDLAPGPLRFDDLAALSAGDMATLLRANTMERLSQALPPGQGQHADPVREAFLAGMSTTLRDEIKSDQRLYRHDWAVRVRAQEEFAVAARQLAADGAITLPPNLPDALAGELSALRRILRDLPLPELRRLLSELTTLDLEVVVGAPPLDMALLSRLELGLAERAGEMLRRAVLRPDDSPVGRPPGRAAQREALRNIKAALAPMADRLITEQQMYEIGWMATRLERLVEAKAPGLDALPGKLPGWMPQELLLRTGGAEGAWGRLLRKRLPARHWTMLMEDLELHGGRPLLRGEADEWLPLAEAALAEIPMPTPRGPGDRPLLERVLRALRLRRD